MGVVFNRAMGRWKWEVAGGHRKWCCGMKRILFFEEEIDRNTIIFCKKRESIVIEYSI